MHGRLSKIKTGVCAHCGMKGKTESALIHGRATHRNWQGAYSINTNDYIELCNQCHRDYDITPEWRDRIRAANRLKNPEMNRRRKEAMNVNN